MKRLSLFTFLGIILIFSTSCGSQKAKNPPKATPKEVVQEKTQDSGKYISKEVVKKKTQESGKYISKDIIELVKDCISKDKGLEYLEKYYTGRELTSKDIAKLNIQGEDKEYLNTILNDEIIARLSRISLVDYDNDGIKEIAFYEFSGGSAGFVYFNGLEKDKSGVYKFANPIKYKDGENFGILSSNEFIKIKGKTYLLTEEYNYSNHAFEGINIYAFSKGKLVEQGYVSKYGDKIAAKTQVVLNKSFNMLIEKLKRITPPVIAKLDDGEVFSGNIEKIVPEDRARKLIILYDSFEPWYEVDIDNNHQLDFIQKDLLLTSSRYTERYLKVSTYLNLNNGKLKNVDILKYFKTEPSEDEVQQIWFEKFLGENYMVVLTQDETNKYYLKIYLVNRTKTEKIGQINFSYIKEIKVKIQKPE